jgi:hypothetical protein
MTKRKSLSYWRGYLAGWWQQRRRYLLSLQYWRGRLFG